MRIRSLVASLVTVAVVATTSLLWSAAAVAGCQINVFVRNTGKSALDIHSRDNRTGVKIHNGTWRALSSGNWWIPSLMPGETKGDAYLATFSCTAGRRYRVYYSCRSTGGTFSDYYPSPTGWTTSQSVTIDLKQCK